MEDRARSLEPDNDLLFYHAEKKAANLEREIGELLDEKGKRLLLELNTTTSDKLTRLIELEYQRGFSEAVKLIFYTLTNI